MLACMHICMALTPHAARMAWAQQQRLQWQCSYSSPCSPSSTTTPTTTNKI